MTINEPLRLGMTLSILEPGDLRELLLEEPPSPHLADLLWAAGDEASARLVYEQMWQEADPDALVTLVTMDHVSSIPNRDAPLHGRAREILEAVNRQAITVTQAQHLLLFLSRLAAFRLRDFDESTRLSFFAARHFDILPLPFCGLRSAGIGESTWRPCLQSLVSRAEQAKAIEERIRRLLLVVMLGAEFKRMDLLWYERLARCAKAGVGSISLYFLLSLLDLCGLITSEAAAADARNYLRLLADSITDEHERFAYTLRHLEFLAFSGGVEEALGEIQQMAAKKTENLRPLLLQKAQLIAFSFSRFDTAAEIAHTRAQETSDPYLRISLLLQAEELFRNSHAEPERLDQIVKQLQAAVRSLDPVAQGILDHALWVLQALTLQTERDEDLAQLWDETADQESSVDRTMSRALHRREEEELVPQTPQVARLIERLYDELPLLSKRAALSLILVGDGWDALASSIDPERIPGSQREVYQRLKAYSQLFRQDEPREALATLRGLFDAYDHTPKTLWALWEAARRADELASWGELFTQRARESPAVPQQALFTALQGASLAALGRIEEAHDMVHPLAQANPASIGLQVINTRLVELIHGATPVQVLSSDQTVRRVIQPAMVELLDRGEQQAAAGNLPEAGRLLKEAALMALETDSSVAISVLVRAGTALLEGEVDLAEAADCFVRAYELDHEDGTAWRGMCSVRARAGRFLEVADLVESRPSFLETELVPVMDLVLSARALRSDHSDRADIIYAFLLESGAIEPSLAENPEELDTFQSIARQAGQLPLYRDLLESLLSQTTAPSVQCQLHLRIGALLATEIPDTRTAVAHLQQALNHPSTKDRSLEILTPLLPVEEPREDQVSLRKVMAEAAEDAQLKVTYLMEAANLLWERPEDRPQVAELLNQVLAIDSKQVPALLRLAEFHQEQQAWDRAVPLLETAARLIGDKPRRSQVYLELGDIQQNQLERPKLALENYVVSFMCDNANRQTFDRLDKLYTAGGRFKDLVGIINVAIQVSEPSPEDSPYDLEDLYARRAHIEFRYLKEPGQAAESLLKALTLNPGNRNYLKLLESYLAKAASPETMLKAYEVYAASLPPDSTELPKLVRARAAYCDQIPQRQQEAIELYSRLLQLEPADTTAFSRLEEYFQQEGRWRDLIRLYHQRLDWVADPDETVTLYQRLASLFETELGDLNAAAQTYSELLDLIPDSIKALRGLSRLYEAMRRWDELIELTEREVALVEDNRVKAHLLFRLGSIYETHRDQEDKAVEYYERAVQFDPGAVPALHGLRDIFQRRGDASSVIKYLKQEIDVWESPRERASIHTRIGEVYFADLEDGDHAIEHFKAALQLVPDSRPSLEGLLDIYFSREAWAEASPIADLLSHHPEAVRSERKSDLFRRRGVIAQHLGNRREALVSLEIALDLDPTNWTALDDLFVILDEEMDAEAHGEFFARLQKELADRNEVAGLARVKRFLGRQAERRSALVEAVAHYGEVLGLYSGDIDSLRDLVRVLGRMHRFDEALERVQRLAEEATQPENWTEANLMAGRLLLDHLDQRPRARELFQRILDKHPDHLQALYLNAQAAYLDQDWSCSRTAMESLTHIEQEADEPPDPQARCEHLFYLGRILEIGFGDTKAAQEHYARAQKVYPLDLRPLKAQALLLLQADQESRLDDLFDQALQAAAAMGGEPATIQPLLLAAKVSRMRQMLDKEETYLKQLLAIDPAHQEARDLLVEVAHERQARGEASTVELHRLLESNVLDGTALHGLAILSLQQGRVDQATRFWRVLELIGDERAKQPPDGIGSVVDAPLAIHPRSDEVSRWIHPELMMSGYIQALLRMGPSLDKLGLVAQPTPPSRSQQLQPEEQQSVDALVAEVLKGFPPLKGSIRCYQEGPRGTAINVLIGEKPTILLEMDCSLASDFQRAVATFLVAYGAELLHQGGYTPIAIPRADLTRVLWWLSCWRQSKSPDPPPEEAFWLGDTSPALLKSIKAIIEDEKKVFIPLEDPQHAQSLAIEIEQAAMLDADRVGLIACNHLRAAVEGVLKLETGFALADLPDVVEELSRSQRLLSLIRYSVSEDYFSVRAQLV